MQEKGRKMRFVINRDKLKDLAQLRGWRSLYTALAESTDFSVSYCRRVVLGREKLTDLFMLRYIKASGFNPKRPAEWASLFEVDLDGTLPPYEHPTWNLHKLHAHGIPYRKYSASYPFRKQDDPNVEEAAHLPPNKTPGHIQ